MSKPASTIGWIPGNETEFIEDPGSTKTEGWIDKTPAPNLQFNWFWNLTSQWINYLDEITQAFICWKRDAEFDESLYLASKLHSRYPHIEVFVRIFDEELIDLVEKYNAKTFSTSSNAFKMLQKEVKPDSAIAPK